MHGLRISAKESCVEARCLPVTQSSNVVGRENKAFYAWVAEPQVEAKGASLRFPEAGTFHPLDAAAVSDIIDRVKAWYDVLPNQIMSA